MGDHPGEVGHPNGVESCQKSIGTIRCNLAISYNNWQRSLIFRQHAASIYGFVRSVCLFRFVVSKKIKERYQLMYDIARLHLMVPIDFWLDSTPFG